MGISPEVIETREALDFLKKKTTDLEKLTTDLVEFGIGEIETRTTNLEKMTTDFGKNINDLHNTNTNIMNYIFINNCIICGLLWYILYISI